MNASPREPRRRRALLLGCSEFTDPSLPTLRSPTTDVRELAAVLRDPNGSNYEVTTKVNIAAHEAQLAIDQFLDSANTQDLHLIYFSGHGIQDRLGSLYFAFTNTIAKLPSSTAVSADWIRERMNTSRSKSTVVLIDCCFSGLFMRGMRSRAGRDANVGSLVGDVPEGSGIAVFTASGETEFSLEDIGDEPGLGTRPSYFTEAVVTGIGTGAADTDGDGRITVDELYDYVYARVKAGPSPQRPRRMGYGEGHVIVALTARRPAEPMRDPPRESAMAAGPGTPPESARSVPDIMAHTDSRTETASRPPVIGSEPLAGGSVSKRSWDADLEPATAAVLTGWQRLSALSGVLLAAWGVAAGALAWLARGVDRRSGFPDYFYAGPALTVYLMVGLAAVVLVVGAVELWWLARYGAPYWAPATIVFAILSAAAVTATFVIAHSVGADHPWTFGWLSALQAIWLTAILTVAWTAIVLARTIRVRKVALRRRWLTDTATSDPGAELRSNVESLTVIPSVRIAQLDEGPLTAVVFAGRRVALIGVVTWAGGVYTTRTWEGDLVRNGVPDTTGSESIGTLHEQARRWRRRLHHASVRTFVLVRNLDQIPLQLPSASDEPFITYVTAQAFVETVGRFLIHNPYAIDINTVWRILRHLPATSVAGPWPSANASRGDRTGAPS